MICSCQSLITYKHLKKFLLPSTCDCVLCTCVAPLKSSSFRKAPPKLIRIYYKDLKEKDQVILFATDKTILRSFIKRQTDGTSSHNVWQRRTTIGTTSGTTSDNKWQWVTSSDSKWYNKWKRHSTLQKMDDCHSFYDKNWYTTSRDWWLILEWLDK